MLSRRALMIAGPVLAAAGPAKASERIPFDQSLFNKAQAAGLPILVHITADWCEVCQAQKAIVADRP